MLNVLRRLLVQEWAGLALGVLIACLGADFPALGFRRGFGWALLAVGIAVAIGGSIHLVRLARRRRQLPPPGRMIDLGGFRVHLLAEGEAGALPPVVWFGGGHSAGLAMIHLHRALRKITRSILIDRPGTGWSDTGPFPRTTAREASEMVEALVKAGETGPYVFVGYSFGGLLAANIARRFPQQVAKLVLLDATPLETIVFGPRFKALSDMRRDALWSGVLRLLGIPVDLGWRRQRRSPGFEDEANAFRTVLGKDLERLLKVEITAGAQFANYSIYRELSPEGIAACGWETVVYDGDLGNLPLYLVAPGDGSDLEALPEMIDSKDANQARMLRFFVKTRERYLAASGKAVRIVAPPGTTHQFIYETPEFVADTVSKIVRGEI